MARTKQTARKKTTESPPRTDLVDKFNNEKRLDISPVIKQLQDDKWSSVGSLNFSGVDQITDTFLLVFKLHEKGIVMESLTSLDLSGCCNITDEGIRWLSEAVILTIDNVVLKGCKQLTHRSIYRLVEKYKYVEIDLTATSCAFFPGQFPALNLDTVVTIKGCPLVSPFYYLYNRCNEDSDFTELYKGKDFVAYPHHKVLVMHTPDCSNRCGIFTGELLTGDLSVQRSWRAEAETSDLFNVFEVVTGNGTEDLVLSNGCIIILPFLTSDDKTAITLASNIITVLAQYPENVFVLASLTSDASLKKVRDKVITILHGWKNFVSGSNLYRRRTDTSVFTECTFTDQMQIGFCQTLLDNLNTLIFNPKLLLTVTIDETPQLSSLGSFGGLMKGSKDSKHSYLISAMKILEKLYPWHMSTFMREPVEQLNMMTKNFSSILPLICPLSEVNEDVKGINSSLSRGDVTEAAVQILHDRGSCVYFPQVSKKPAITDITALPTIANLTGKAPHRAYIQGLGPDVPCWRKNDLSSLNKTIEKHDNLLLSVLKKQGLVFQFPCSLSNPEFTDIVLYVLTQDLPDNPYLLLDKVWPTDLLEGEEQRDSYMTFPALPTWVLPCFLRKLQEMSKVLLMWKTGLVIRQGPVMVLVKLTSNMACGVSDLPALVISARVMNNMGNTLALTFNNIRTMLDAMLQKRKIFAVKSVCCESCNPARSIKLALSTDCCQVKEMDVRLSERPVTCSKTGSGVVITKETLSPPGLSRIDHIPNHKYMLMMTQGFTKKLYISPRCFLCNNCCLRGIHCPHNLRRTISSRLCNCKLEQSLCVYCGVCDQCLLQFTKAHATVQPSFHTPDGVTDSAERAGSLVTFSAGQQYSLPDFLCLGYNKRLTILLNSGNQFIIKVQHTVPKGPVFTLMYITSTGKLTKDEKECTDTVKGEKLCERYDWLDFLIVSDDTDQYRKELQIKKNGNIIFRNDTEDIGRTCVDVTSVEDGSIFVYTPHLIRMEKIDTKNKENFISGPVVKCCGPFPTVLERRISVMIPVLERTLLNNISGEMVYTGAAGVMLPKTLTWEDVVCPTPRLLQQSELYHPICLVNVHKPSEQEDKFNWRHRSNLLHLVNAEGHKLSVSDEITEQLIWGWHCLLTQYPLLDLPPAYDQLFPELTSSAGQNDHRDELIGQGVHELMRLYTIYKLSSYGNKFDKDNILSITGSANNKSGPLSSSAKHLQSIVSDNPERSGLTSFHKKRLSFVCPCHAACRSPSIRGSNLTEIPKVVFTGNPKLITCLQLPGNRLTSVPPDTFINLPHLTKLDLSNNYIDVLPESIGLCKDLFFINMETNNLVDLPSSLANCNHVNQIHISSNRMQVLPSVLVQMKGIKHVFAFNMMLTGLPEDIGEMPKLTFLLLKGNCLTSLPKSFANLQNLTTLAVTGVKWIQNQAKHFISKSHFLKFLEDKNIKRWIDAQPEKLTGDQLYQLFDLDGSGLLDTSEIARLNAVVFKLFTRFGHNGQDPPDDSFPSGFPEEILALKNLKSLDLSHQGIVHVPPGISNLENLSSLTLSHNPHLLSIAAEASLCPLTKLFVDECPLLKTPPKEIRERGFKTMFGYLSRLLKGSVDCKRTKLMLVGLGGAGKTSLVKTLTSTDKRSTLTGADAITDGIDICTWDVDHQGEKISYSVWDFAGQTVYYNTHQFFLSDRAVYLLLWNTRLGHEHAGLKFWLNSITVHAPKAPIFVVGTHSDQMTKMELPVDEMRQKYHQIVGFHFVSSKTGDGIPNLQEDLFKVTIQQDYMGEKIPHAWLQLESLISKERTKGKVNVMMYEKVEQKASEAGIVDPTEIAEAIQFLHDLGSVQYFPTEHLKGHVVINPQWIVDVMACVVSVKQEGIKDGRLMHSDLDAVWSEYHSMTSWLLRLTEEFDLTFPLEGESCNIVPCLLPEKRPDFEWPDITKDEGIYEMKLVYRFDYLPSGLFNRAQVRLHGYSEESMIWKRGSFIEKNGQLALIQHDGESELSVKVQGPNPSNMLFFIHEVLEGLINESFQGVTYDYEIPCPDCTKHYQKDPHMFKASSIRRALELKAPFLQCQKQFHTASILSLQGILAPDTNSDYEVHLDQDVNNLLQMQKEMATDIFISYCSRDAPKDRSEVIHPADIYADLEKEGFSCYFPEGGALYSREEMAQHLVHSSVFLVLISNNYAADEVCCDMYKYAVSTMKRPTICVAVGENFDWKKSPSLGVIMSDVVFVNMINSKKQLYETKLKELLSTLQKQEQISQVKPETIGSCFISYSWANSRLAVECGTKELPGALGFGDPRHIKEYLEGKGIKCWLDIDEVSVNDQLLNRIAEGLSEARVVVACVSDQYAQSKMCCKEMRFAVQLELPVVVAIVGSGKQWKRSEVGFNSMSYPAVDFQRPNPNAYEDLLTLIKSEMLPERAEVTERRQRKDHTHNDRANTSFKEMYELAQRKFLRQISNYAVSHDMSSYPRLFVVDIVDNKTPDLKNSLPNEEEFKSRKFCIHTMCECEQGWHSACDPLELGVDFTGEDLEEYASYLAHVTVVMKHSPDFVLNLFSDVHGQQYLNYIQEMTLKGGSNFATSYQRLRQKVFEMDLNSVKGKLRRCRLTSGKIIWLCKDHITKLTVTVLSENIKEVQQKSTNQVWVEAMMEALRLDQNLPLTFRPTAIQSRMIDSTAEDVAEVERHTKMTLSRTASTLDKAAIIQASQVVQGSDPPRKKKEKKPKKERRRKRLKEDEDKSLGEDEKQPVREDTEKLQIEDGEKSQIEDGEKPQEEDGDKLQKEEGEKHQKRGRRENKESGNEDSEGPLEVSSQATPTKVDVDNDKTRPIKSPHVQQGSVETQGLFTNDSPTRITEDKPAPTPDSSLGMETVEQRKELTAQDFPSSNENGSAHKFSHQYSRVISISQVNPNPNTPTSAVPPMTKHTDTENIKDSSQQDKAVSKTCTIL